ncbi:hypothetical protein AVEN_194813-1 [Araneus ventricosus]|uniref:Cuticle protein 16.8 n=1 Tax=Araneus ventricosus TaxID=182803 RepID=A0A4Y2B5I2_ARAVE|nr:hypothetical protein AVEN_194813-1 [Araneus ventricosus]
MNGLLYYSEGNVYRDLLELCVFPRHEHLQPNVLFQQDGAPSHWTRPAHSHDPQQYAFGFSVGDHHNEQHRQESGDGHTVRGSYGFTDANGVHRQVYYVADHAGFRAQVKTNEPGTASQNPASAQVISDVHARDHHGHPSPYARYGIPQGGYGYGLTTGLLGGLGLINYGF